MESARRYLAPSDEHPHLVLCGVADEAELLREQQRWESRGIEHCCFREPDRNNELTAIASQPLSGAMRKFMKRYRLLGSSQNDEGAKSSYRSRASPS